MSKTRLLDRVRDAIRIRHYSLATEKAYVSWIRRLILFHGKRHPAEMKKPDVEAFLSYLAVRRNVSPSTQNQALQAILFLFRHVLDAELPWLDEVVRAKSKRRVPVVLSRKEVRLIIKNTPPAQCLPISLISGAVRLVRVSHWISRQKNAEPNGPAFIRIKAINRLLN